MDKRMEEAVAGALGTLDGAAQKLRSAHEVAAAIVRDFEDLEVSGEEFYERVARRMHDVRLLRSAEVVAASAAKAAEDLREAAETRLPDQPLVAAIAAACGARKRCLAEGNPFAKEWDERLDQIEREHLPSGSGIDSGTKVDRDRSGDDVVVLTTSFHHMNANGFYDGWTDHDVRVRPGFQGLDIKVGGRNRNDVKEHLAEVFDAALSQPFRWPGGFR